MAAVSPLLVPSTIDAVSIEDGHILRDGGPGATSNLVPNNVDLAEEFALDASGSEDDYMSANEQVEEEEAMEERKAGPSRPRPNPKPMSKGSFENKPTCRSEKRFTCTVEGCDRAYTKPSRLEEHMRTHNGVRPYVCNHCTQAYFRDTHLKAHMRTHMSDSDKALQCTVPGCTQTFWTSSKLKRHEATHANDGAFSCAQCDAKFNKHNLLRGHVAEVHQPEGTKPFMCTHADCAMSFLYMSQLKLHQKTHDTKRYTCSHESHGILFLTFAKWSDLQKHMTVEHPPVCRHPECKNRTFKNAARLKDHMRVHADRDTDITSIAEMHDGEGSTPQLLLDGIGRKKRRRSLVQSDEVEANEGVAKKMKKLVDGSEGKDWACDHDGCDKKYKKKSGLEAHIKVVHLRIRSFVCPHEDCGKSYAQKHNLQQHIARSHSPGLEQISSRPTTPKNVNEGSLLTGAIKEIRRYGCPAWVLGNAPKASKTLDTGIGAGYVELPSTGLQVVISHDNEIPPVPVSQLSTEVRSAAGTPPVNDTGRICAHRFWRVYDVRRHLSSEHGIDLEDMEVRRLLLNSGQTGDWE